MTKRWNHNILKIRLKAIFFGKTAKIHLKDKKKEFVRFF